MPQILRIVSIVVIVTAVQSEVQAQMFGARPLGQTLSRGPNTGLFGTSGQIQGSARYLRGNRSRNDFVGTDQGDRTRFVGSTQARTSGNVASAANSLAVQPDRSKQINQPLTPPGNNAVYLPVLRLDWSAPERPATELQTRLQGVLSNSPRFSPESRFEVLVEGKTAILRGEASSAKERALAETVLRLEPGVSQVRNELELRTAPSLPEPPQPDPELLPGR